jgi:hypothetical protein
MDWLLPAWLGLTVGWFIGRRHMQRDVRRVLEHAKGRELQDRRKGGE